MRAYSLLLGVTAYLLSILNISDSQSEHNAGTYFGRTTDPHRITRQIKNPSREYRDYSDYGQEGRPDFSKSQWEDTLSRQQGSASFQDVALSPHNVSSVHRRKEQSADQEPDDHLHVIDNWPDPSKHLGQLSAVSIDMDGNVVVFHRGDRNWNGQTFLPNNIYNQRDLGPITENTVVVFNASTGKVVREWGTNMFYMPHGLTVDSKNNFWLTDVALHQVFKFTSNGKMALMSLGARFIPGNDNDHFCKPSDVAVMANGEFFVSDGYCNNRVIKYSKAGKLLMQWGRSTFKSGMVGKVPAPYEFSVPHALALAEDRNLLCVADRENGRIQCFNTYNGSFIMQLHSPKMGSRLFSVAYSPIEGGLLYIVNGPDMKVSVKGFVIKLDTNEIIEEFSPHGHDLHNPHDVAVSPDGNQVYVVEINPYKVWKFAKGNAITGHIDINADSGTVSKTKDTSATSSAPPNLSKLPSKPLDSPEQSTSIATALAVIIAVVAILVIIITVAIVRMRKKGYNGRCNRWEFPKSPVEGFKLGQFLDRHQGFEKVNTEESDDEGSSGSTEVPSHPTQFA